MTVELSPRVRRRLRRAGLAGLALVAGLAVAWLAAGLLFQALVDRGHLARWSEARLEAALNRDVELREVSLSAFPRPTAVLSDLRIGNPPGFDAPPLARIDRVRLQVAIWPLFRRRIVVEEVQLSDAALRLATLPDGRTNFGDFSPAGGPEPPSGPPPFRLRVEEVELEGGSVSYRGAATGPELEARDLSGRARLGAGEEGRELHLTARAGSVRVPPSPDGPTPAAVPVRLELEGRLPDGDLVVERGRATVAEIALGITGRVDSLARPARQLDLRVAADTVELADVADLVRRLRGDEPDGGGDDPELAGRLSLDLGVRGPWGPGRRPVVDGLARLSDGRVAGGDATLARDLAGQARVDGDSVIVERLRGRLLDGDLDADGVLRMDSARSWRFRVRARPRLRSLAARTGADTALLDGAVEADLALRGRGARSASIRAAGTLRAHGVVLARPGWEAPLRVPTGTVRLSGDSAAGAGLPVVVAGDTLGLDLAVAGVPSRLLAEGPVPTFEATLRGPRLDLDALLGTSPGDEVTRTRLALARLGGRPVEGRSAERLAAARAGLPDSAPASGTLRVELDELVRRPRRLTGVSARLELAPGRLGVAEADFGAHGGRARLSGEASLGAAPAPFRLQVQGAGLDAEVLLATSTPVGRLVTGRAELSLEVAGRLDSLLLPLPEGLSGEGRLVFTEGRMRPNPVTSALAATLRAPGLESPGFRRWEQPFTLRGDTLFLAPSAPEGTALPLRLGGAIRLGGGLELALVGEVPAATARELAGQVGGLPGSLLDRVAGSGPLPVALRVVGTVEEPRVELDEDALRDVLEEAARREAGDAARREAGALLRRILGRTDEPPADTAADRDTVRTAPADTAAGRDTAGTAPADTAADRDTAGTAPADTAADRDTAGTAPGGG